MLDLRFAPFSALALALAAGLSAQATWTDVNPATTPQARYRSSMTSFPGGAGNEFVMFGGAGLSGSTLGETWKWDGSDWTLLSLATKPKLEGAAACLHPPTSETVSFSGWTGSVYVKETYTFDGTAWTSQAPVPSPPPRDMSQMAFHPGTGNAILFGGHDWQFWFASGGNNYGDTWSWNGTSWTQLSPSTNPPGRARHVMCYDGTSGNLIMLGGTTTQDQMSGGLYSDMWSWDGADWTQLHPATLPPSRNDAMMAWDPARNVVVLHGGVDSPTGTVLQDTWEWDGISWTLVAPASAGPAASGSVMQYDSVTGDMVLFGGALSVDLSLVSDKTYAFTGVPVWQNLGFGLAGALGEPVLTGHGQATASNPVTYKTVNAATSAQGFLVAGLGAIHLPIFGGTLVPAPNAILSYNADGSGTAQFVHTYGATTPLGVPIYVQAWFIDGTGPQGLTASNGIFGTTQ